MLPENFCFFAENNFKNFLELSDMSWNSQEFLGAFGQFLETLKNFLELSGIS